MESWFDPVVSYWFKTRSGTETDRRNKKEKSSAFLGSVHLFMSKRVLCLIIVLVGAAGSWPLSGRFGLLKSLASVAKSQDVTVEQVLIRGNRRIPESTIRIWIGTREGDPYNPGQVD